MNENFIKIGNKKAGAEDLFFVVEEAQANLGDFDKAISMIEAASRLGADAIEFQLAIAEDFYVKNDPGYGVYLKRQFTNKDISELVNSAKSKGLEFIATPLSHRLVEPLVKAGCCAFNINATDINNPDIIDAVAFSGLPFFLSLLLASEEEIAWAVTRIKKRKASSFALLHGQHVMASGHSGVDAEHTALGFIANLKKEYNVPVGFIDHTGFKWFPAVAAGAGADIITKHIAISRSDKGPDWEICLEPQEMKEAIDLARKVRKSYLTNSKKLAPGEDMDKTLMRRSIIAAKALRSGDVVMRSDVCFKRPGTGIDPSKLEFILGKKVIRDIQVDEQIEFSDLEV